MNPLGLWRTVVAMYSKTLDLFCDVVRGTLAPPRRRGLYEHIARSGEPDYAMRCCKDCRFLRGAVNLICTNEDALRETGGACLYGKVKDCSF